MKLSFLGKCKYKFLYYKMRFFKKIQIVLGYIVPLSIVIKLRGNMKTMKNIEWMSNKIDDIFCVSKACKYNMEQAYPELNDKLRTFYNIIDQQDIKERALRTQHDIPEDEKNVLLTIDI